MNTESLKTALVLFQENAEMFNAAGFKTAAFAIAGLALVGYGIKRFNTYLDKEVHTRDENEVLVEPSSGHKERMQKKINEKAAEEYKKTIEALKENPTFISHKELAKKLIPENADSKPFLN